jgi:conjugal transfer mating pair stabilization protein TraG
MAWEVYTLGGGDYLYTVFNGIKALVDSHSYVKLIALSGMLALFWALLQSAFNNQFKNTATWAVSFMLMYNVMFLPKVEIVINDPLNRATNYRKVDGVPAALGIFASLSSNIGFRITELMETAFSLPDDLKYQKSGMIFGSRLLGLTSAVKINDSDFAASVHSYMKQCVFYDILLHRYTLAELKNAPDIWEFLKTNPSKARSFEMHSPAGRKITTCALGIKDLESRWKGETDNATNQLAELLTPITKVIDKQPNNSARNLFMSGLPISYEKFFNISKTSTDIFRQNMLINALDTAAADFSNTGAHGANIYTTVRSDLQTKAAFRASKVQAEHWMPIFKTVLEVLFYGAFPLVFLLFLMPIGSQVAKSYFMGFIWLQTWAPLYAIINMIATSWAVYQSQTLAGGMGMTIASHAGIIAVNQNVAEMAGFLAWFVPFIAGGLLYGLVSATSGLATSMLAIPQSAASAAASEVATGNISLGNFNMGNGSYGNLSSNKINDSTFFDSGRVQAINQQGGITTMTPDGRTVYDQTGSVTRIPNLQVTSNDTTANSLSQMASSYQNMGENLAMQSAVSKAQSIDQMSQYMASHSVNENHGVRFAQHAAAETREAYNRLELAANDLARDQKIDKGTAFSMIMSGNLGLGNGGSGAGGSKGFGFGISSSGTSDSRSSQTYGDTERVTRSHQLQKDVGTVLNAISDRSLEFTDAHGHNLNNSINEGLSESKRLEDQSRAYFDVSKNFSNQAQFVKSQSISFNQDLMPQFIEFAQNTKKLNGQALGHEALHIMANDPVQTKELWDSFQKSNLGMQNIHNTFDSAKARIGIDHLQQDYSSKAQKISSDLNEMPSGMAQNQFNQATEGKLIHNDNLKTDVNDQIHNNRRDINQVQIDREEVGTEIKGKLKDDAVETKIKSVFLSATPNKSNFNNEE